MAIRTRCCAVSAHYMAVKTIGFLSDHRNLAVTCVLSRRASSKPLSSCDAPLLMFDSSHLTEAALT